MDEIHFFYINCDQDTERKKNMEKQWLNISKKSFLHRYRATHFNTINPQYLTETTKFSNEYVEKNENKFAPSIAVFKSHIGLWKKIIDKQIKYAIIFEDDVFIPDNFLDIVNEEMGEFCKNTDKWDILFFGVLKLYAEKTNNPKLKFLDRNDLTNEIKILFNNTMQNLFVDIDISAIGGRIVFVIVQLRKVSANVEGLKTIICQKILIAVVLNRKYK